MRNRYITEECNKILNFWKLEEYFTPSDYPELTLTIKEGKQDIPFDAYYNAYSTRSLPLKEYKAHNEYLRQKHKSDEKLYNRANVYCGCYNIKTFVEKMAEKCKLDMEKYAEINELSGRFYIFSVQIDLDGKLTEEGVQISPFFYAVLCMIKSEGMPDRGRGLARPSCGVGVVRSFFRRKSHSAPAARLPGLCPGPSLFICGKKNISFHKPRHFFIISKWGK